MNLALLIVRMFIETGAAIIGLAPLRKTIAIAYGIDPSHFGIVTVVNLFAVS